MLVKRLLEYRINPAKFAENRKDYKTANEIIGDATRVLVNAEVEDTRQDTNMVVKFRVDLVQQKGCLSQIKATKNTV